MCTESKEPVVISIPIFQRATAIAIILQYNLSPADQLQIKDTGPVTDRKLLFKYNKPIPHQQTF